jgi:excisionase family DNA binding protein
MLNVNQVMEALNLGRTILYRMLAAKEIKAIKVGTRWKIPKKSLEEFVNKRLPQD